MAQITEGLAYAISTGEGYTENEVRQLAYHYGQLTAKIQEQAAEIEKLKTVPMRYRRMKFNAELQDQLTTEQANVKVLVEALEDAREAFSDLTDGADEWLSTFASQRILDIGKALAVVKGEK